MITEKLYETDSHLSLFRAKVLSCAPAKKGFDVVLDRTAFFPEGGGQAADTGFIGEVPVADVKLQGETVLHKTSSPLTEGEEYDCRLDWDTRFSRMQNHSAEHIVSGLLHALYGCTNVGFHMGSGSVSLDLDLPLTGEIVAEVEKKANEAVTSDLPVTCWYPSPEELASLDYRSKIDLKSGVRLVRIGDVDLCACCAPHVKTTGEIGLVKILSFSPNKGGTRVEMLAGREALADYSMLHRANSDLMRLFSAKRGEVVSSAEKMQAALLETRGELRRLKEKIAWDSLSLFEKDALLGAFLSPCSYDEMRYCLNRLREEKPSFSLYSVFSRGEGEETLYMAASSAQKGDVRPFVSHLNGALRGKGGGRPDFAQGRVAASEREVRAFLSDLSINIP